MNRLRHANSNPLDELVKLALGYAEFSMRNVGRVQPTFLAQTGKGLSGFLPESMGNVKAKDSFANTGRLLAIAQNASAVAMIMEAWIAVSRDGKPVDTTVPPSQSPDREECVIIRAESAGSTRTRILSIQRDGSGAFTGFGTGDFPQVEQMEGRFADMMPPRPPSAEDRKMARHLLRMMGLDPDDMGFDPQWN